MTTAQREEIFRSNGKYFGYPQCCIDAFILRFRTIVRTSGTSDATTKEQLKAGKYGFIPCQEHAVKLLDEEITIPELLINREAPYPFGPTEE